MLKYDISSIIQCALEGCIEDQVFEVTDCGVRQAVMSNNNTST